MKSQYSLDNPYQIWGRYLECFWNIPVSINLKQAEFMTILSFDLQVWQMALLLVKENNCARLFWNPCINVEWPGQAQFMTILSLTFKCDLDFQPTWKKKVSNGTSPPQGQHLCKIILKSMHKCRSYGLDKSRWMHSCMNYCIHIHRTKIVTAMSGSPKAHLTKIITDLVSFGI